MKRAALLAALISALALFATAPAFAQTPAEKPVATPAPPKAERSAPASPKGELALPASPKTEHPAASASPKAERQAKAKTVPKTRRAGRANADARHCLDLKTNPDIIKCANRYL